MEKILGLALVTIFTTDFSFAHEIADSVQLGINKRHSIYAELGGNSNLASLNYEYFSGINQQAKHQIGVRFGVGISGSESRKFTLPLGIHYLFALYKQYLFADIGLGYTYTNAYMHGLVVYKIYPPITCSNCNSNFIPSAGLRLQTGNGYFIRGNLLLIVNRRDSLPHFGISVGKRF